MTGAEWKRAEIVVRSGEEGNADLARLSPLVRDMTEPRVAAALSAAII